MALLVLRSWDAVLDLGPVGQVVYTPGVRYQLLTGAAVSRPKIEIET